MARKTATSAAQALREYKKFSSHNTKVVIDEEGNASMYLFGNRIAFRAKKGDRLFVTTCGWNTSTTRSRLNEIAPISVRTGRGQLTLNGNPWDGKWVEIIEAPPFTAIAENEPPIID